MIAPPLECVVDASVGIKIFIVEVLSERAHALFSQLGQEPPALLYVPDLFFVDCANVLWKHVRRKGYPSEKARRDVVDLTSLSLRTVPAADLVEDALAIALARNITPYDGCYVALAHRLQLPLITADQALIRRLAGTPYPVRWLGDFPLRLSSGP